MELSILSETLSGNFTVQTVSCGEFVIQLIKSLNAPPSAVFLPAQVSREGIVLWRFQRNHPSYNGLAKLIEVNGEFVIALCNRDHRHLDRVIPILDLPSLIQTKDGDFVGGRRLQDFIRLKEGAAKRLQLEPQWSVREERMRTALNKACEAKRKQEQEEMERKRAVAREEKIQRRAAITSRKRISAYTLTGDRRHGIPVVGDEWRALSIDTFCISVESFDAETRVVGKPIESFIVDRKKGDLDRAMVTSVSSANPVAQEQTSAKKIETVVIELRGELEEVLVAQDMDHIRKLAENGLNGGTLVMCPKSDNAKLYSVFRLKDGEIQSAGQVGRVAAT